jgi:hypothetical protein
MKIFEKNISEKFGEVKTGCTFAARFARENERKIKRLIAGVVQLHISESSLKILEKVR